MAEIVTLRARQGDTVTRLLHDNGIECRGKADDTDDLRIGGLAVPYEVETVIWEGRWITDTEVIARGAFAESLRNNGIDVMCCIGHDRSLILGRQTNKSLTLDDRDDGLHYECRLNDKVTRAQDLFQDVKRQDVKGTSIRFRVDEIETKEQRGKDGRWIFRDRILKARLYAVDPVTDPAYTSTTAETRARRDLADRDYEEFQRLMRGQ